MNAADRIREWEWELCKIRKRKRLKNKSFSIISSNCSGTCIYHDLKCQFSSPTINLSIEMNDFVRMVKSLKWYMEQRLVQIKSGERYPVGLLGDVRVRFMHYKTFDEAAQKWDERKKRINWDNLFIIGTDRAGCTYETIKDFEKLPYANKVIFTHVRYPEFPSAYYIKGFEKEKELGIIVDFKKQFFKRRFLDDFDYIKFLNGQDVCGR